MRNPRDPDGTIVSEEMWHARKADERFAKLGRLTLSEAQRLLRQAVAIGGNEVRRCNAWAKLRDHRVRLITPDSRIEVTEELWRSWVAEGKPVHDPRGCLITNVDERDGP